MKHSMIVLAGLCAAAFVSADVVPEVSGVVMQQGTGSRLVTVDYTLSSPAVVTLDIQTNAVDGAWVSIGGENIQQVTGDVWRKVEAGTRQIKWRPDLSWPDHKIEAGGARAVVTAWSLDNPPDYLVVDLVGAAGSETYYPSAAYLPGGLLKNPDYRTSRLVLRKIAAAGVTWTMGSAETEPGYVSWSEALHNVTLANNYYIGVFQVTQAQWAIVNGGKPSHFAVNQSMRPVEQVSHTAIYNGGDGAYNWPSPPHASSFLGKLRTKTGLAFDLPSEAQWEFAARAGHGVGYWGDGSPILSTDQDANLGRIARVYFTGGKVQDGSGAWVDAPADSDVDHGTAVVGSYQPNDWGLYDMNGNLWEWCQDWYEHDITGYNGATNAQDGDHGLCLNGNYSGERVMRGGGWPHPASSCRPACRNHAAPSLTTIDIGFRVSLPL